MKKGFNISQSLAWAVLATCALNTVETKTNVPYATRHPIIEAARKGNKSELLRLLDQHRDKRIDSFKDSWGRTALANAAETGQDAIVDLLLKRGANPFSPLHQAAISGNQSMAALLLKSGVNPNIKDIFETTLLHFAARNGHKNVATLLLNHGANKDAQDKWDRTPLFSAAMDGYWAVKGGPEAVVTLLLERGADPKIKDVEGKMPLDITSNPKIKALLQKAMDKRTAPVKPVATTTRKPAPPPQKQNIVRSLVAQYKELRALRAKRKAGKASPAELKKLDDQMNKIKKAAVTAGAIGAFIAGVATSKLTKKTPPTPWSKPSKFYEEKATQTKP